jgi:hypothetical protein
MSYFSCNFVNKNDRQHLYNLTDMYNVDLLYLPCMFSLETHLYKRQALQQVGTCRTLTKALQNLQH